MNAPDQLIRDAAHALSEMGEHLDAIGDFTSMTLLLLTAPDVEDDCPGLHRVMILIRHVRFAVPLPDGVKMLPGAQLAMCDEVTTWRAFLYPGNDA